MQALCECATACATEAGQGWTCGAKGPRIGPVAEPKTTGGRRAASAARRPLGTGSLLVRTDSRGCKTWYGKWRAGERQRMRKLGPQREPGSAVGLTRTQAEAELRRLSGEEQERPVRERLNLAALGE